jgi:two-component system LytT family response regulator
MSKLRVIVADDERPAREFLKKVLLATGMAELIGEADNGSDTVDLIRSVKPDLALLDLQMPQLNGMDAVRQLSNDELPLVAFVTAFDEFAVKAFELNAIDYLLKPVEQERLTETLNRAADRLKAEGTRADQNAKLRSAAETYAADSKVQPLSRIPIRVRDEIRLVPVEDIASVIADGELLQIHSAEGNQRYTINFRLKDLEQRLDETKFVRVSRGSLVNMDHVDSFVPLPGGTYEVRLANGQQIASSRHQSRILREKLLKM